MLPPRTAAAVPFAMMNGCAYWVAAVTAIATTATITRRLYGARNGSSRRTTAGS